MKGQDSLSGDPADSQPGLTASLLFDHKLVTLDFLSLSLLVCKMRTSTYPLAPWTLCGSNKAKKVVSENGLYGLNKCPERRHDMGMDSCPSLCVPHPFLLPHSNPSLTCGEGQGPGGAL